MFKYYNNIVTKVVLKELTAEQKLAILDGFAKGISVTGLKHEINVPTSYIQHLYNKIKEVENRSRVLMRGEVLITEAEYNEEGNEIKLAEYNKPPTTALQLKNAVKADFVDSFSENQIIAILTKMVEYSRYLGKGTWEFYAQEVIK